MKRSEKHRTGFKPLTQSGRNAGIAVGLSAANFLMRKLIMKDGRDYKMYLDKTELMRRLFLRFKGIESGKAVIGPETVQIHITNQCNLMCRYCYYYGPGTKHQPDGKTHIPFDVFVRIVRDCIDLKVDTVILSGQGEPTIHPHFCKMMDYLEYQPLSVRLFSNGTFPLKYCANILKAVDHIIINLGEADRASYRYLQGKDFFVRVIKNIRELARLKSQLNPNFRLEVVFLKTSLNEKNRLKNNNLVKKMGVEVFYPKVAETYEHNKHIQALDDEEKTEFVEEWEPCYQGWFYSSIKLNGNVNVCCVMQRIILGNIYKISFKNIWESEKYRAVRRPVLRGEPFRIYHECINCCMALHNKRIGENIKIYDRNKKRYDRRKIIANSQ